MRQRCLVISPFTLNAALLAQSQSVCSVVDSGLHQQLLNRRICCPLILSRKGIAEDGRWKVRNYTNLFYCASIHFRTSLDVMGASLCNVSLLSSAMIPSKSSSGSVRRTPTSPQTSTPLSSLTSPPQVPSSSTPNQNRRSSPTTMWPELPPHRYSATPGARPPLCVCVCVRVLGECSHSVFSRRYGKMACVCAVGIHFIAL